LNEAVAVTDLSVSTVNAADLNNYGPAVGEQSVTLQARTGPLKHLPSA
jgi:hypothetical protein